MRDAVFKGTGWFVNGVCSRGGRGADAAHGNSLEAETPFPLESCEKKNAEEKRDEAVARACCCVALSGLADLLRAPGERPEQPCAFVFLAAAVGGSP